MMINKLVLYILLCFSPLVYAQVGIGTSQPEGILHLQNTDKELGLVIPIVTSAESTTTLSDLIAVEATLVYDNEKKCLRIKKSENDWSACLIDAGIVNKRLAKKQTPKNE